MTSFLKNQTICYSRWKKTSWSCRFKSNTKMILAKRSLKTYTSWRLRKWLWESCCYVKVSSRADNSMISLLWSNSKKNWTSFSSLILNLSKPIWSQSLLLTANRFEHCWKKMKISFRLIIHCSIKPNSIRSHAKLVKITMVSIYGKMMSQRDQQSTLL